MSEIAVAITTEAARDDGGSVDAIGAIASLVRRDLRGFLRSRSQLYSSVLFPLMLLAILGTGVNGRPRPEEHSRLRDVPDAGHDRDDRRLLIDVLQRVVLPGPRFGHPEGAAGLAALGARGLLGKTLSAVIIGAAQALLVLAVAAAIPAIHFQWQYGVLGSLLVSVFAIVLLNLFLSGLGQYWHRDPQHAGFPSRDEPRAVSVSVLLRRILPARPICRSG